MWQHFGRIMRQHPSRLSSLAVPSSCHVQSFVSLTAAKCLAAKTINVPTMGDSITEGTVVEWLVEPGQAVAPDDVVAMVETDKVTIEIKADIAGVVTKHFSAVDETVEVGSPLYEIDTDATATATSTSSSSNTSETPSESTESSKEEAPKPVEEEPVVAASSSSSTAESSTQHRTPRIQFLGKEGWAARLKGETSPAEQEVVDLPPIHPMYGRPAFSEEEMEALMLGGAEQAPKVVAHSSGAIFTY